MSTRFSTNRWAPDDRPREKLVKYGHKSLTNSEFLAILLGSGTPNESADMLAHRMWLSKTIISIGWHNVV